MHFSLLFLIPLVAISAAHPFGAPCNCGLGSGESVCGTRRCSPLVVRPVEVPRPVLPTAKVVCSPVGGITPLMPIGGPCTCHTSLVKPAMIPKSPCSACGFNGRIDISNDQRMTASQKQQILFGEANMDGPVAVQTAPIVIDDDHSSPVNPAHYAPADPVSLHVAYKLSQESNSNNDEGRLSFGFRTLPKDIPLYLDRKSNDNIPEENLFSLNGHIVELKKTESSSTKSIDEEAREQLLQMAEEEEEEKLDAGVRNVKQISLGELGYGLAKIEEPRFVDIKPTSGGIPDDGLGHPINSNDGFKPGRVIITHQQMPESLERTQPLPAPCPDRDVDDYLSSPNVPSNGLFSSPYAYLSSSSSSSAASSNMYKSSTHFQNLRYD